MRATLSHTTREGMSVGEDSPCLGIQTPSHDPDQQETNGKLRRVPAVRSLCPMASSRPSASSEPTDFLFEAIPAKKEGKQTRSVLTSVGFPTSSYYAAQRLARLEPEGCNFDSPQKKKKRRNDTRANKNPVTDRFDRPTQKDILARFVGPSSSWGNPQPMSRYILGKWEIIIIYLGNFACSPPSSSSHCAYRPVLPFHAIITFN